MKAHNKICFHNYLVHILNYSTKNWNKLELKGLSKFIK